MLIFIIAITFDTSVPVINEGNYSDVSSATISIETSLFPDKVLLVSDAISYFMEDHENVGANEIYKSFDGNKQSLNIGVPLTFKYSVKNLPKGVEIISAVLTLSENTDYRNALTYALNLEDSHIDVYNLKTGTVYYYCLDLNLDNDSVIRTSGTFETEDTPRILNIEGAVNVRDVGGWTTVDGKKIKQGLLFRGSEIDGAVVPEYNITDRGKRQLVEELGIRFDLDLRSSADISTSIPELGPNVAHQFYSIGQYTDIFNEYNKAKILEIFRELANIENYPIYVHCTYGRDRTGTVVYLLGALLGMTDSDLQKDYELSAFTYSTVNESEFEKLKDEISKLNGNTTQQKVEGYLLSIGITHEEITQIREIFLEE